MHSDVETILGVLDANCRNFTFPMLDNGYVYLAATRLALFRSEKDWAMVIEVFGFSPRTGFPDTHIHTFASRLHNRDAPSAYASEEAYRDYLSNNPNNESRFVFPISEGNWIDPDDGEAVTSQGELSLRDKIIPLPTAADYLSANIVLEREKPTVFELCRYLAHGWRNEVLASPAEQRVSIPPEMSKLLQLEEWHHPNIVAEQLPSQTNTFRQLAEVLSTGNASHYRPTESPNTHWKNWPEGGRL